VVAEVDRKQKERAAMMQSVPRDASVTTKGRKNRMCNQPLNSQKTRKDAPGKYHAFKSPKGSCLVPLQA
jgi:hypothetical protein